MEPNVPWIPKYSFLFPDSIPFLFFVSPFHELSLVFITGKTLNISILFQLEQAWAVCRAEEDYLRGASEHESLMRGLHATEWSRVCTAKKRKTGPFKCISVFFGTTCIWFSLRRTQSTPMSALYADRYQTIYGVLRHISGFHSAREAEREDFEQGSLNQTRGWSADMYSLPFLLNAELNKMLCDMAHLRPKCAFSAAEIFSIWRSAS